MYHQARVGAVGPAVFTLINSLPRIAAATLLCKEIVLASESPVSAALQIVLALSPWLLQMLGGALLLHRKNLADDATSTSEARSVYIIIRCTLLSPTMPIESSA